MHDPLNLPARASDAGPDNPISPDSEIRRVRELLDEILNAWDGAPLRAGRQAEPDHASEARALADINRRLAEEFGI